MSEYLKDLLERVLWTAAEAGVAVAITETADLHTAYAPLIATGLAVLKGWLAKKVGDPDTAGTRKARA